jgi:MYXO-CTERM domain-containing protein
MNTHIWRSGALTPALALTLASVAFTGNALAAAPTNLDGSAGLHGWQAAGDVAVRSGTVAGLNLGSNSTFVLGTASGIYQDDAQTAGTFNLSGQDPAEVGQLGGVESALNQPLGLLGAEAYEGSALSQGFSVIAGDKLHFEWRLATRTAQADLASQPDSAWLSTVFQGGGGSNIVKLADLGLLSGTTAVNGWLDSGWQGFDLTLGQSGELTLGWAVVDQGSYVDSSWLAVRAVSVTAAVPEPESWGLAVLSLGLLWAGRRRAR